MVKRYAVMFGDFDGGPNDPIGFDSYDGGPRPVFVNRHQAEAYAQAQAYRGGPFHVVEVVATYGGDE